MGLPDAAAGQRKWEPLAERAAFAKEYVDHGGNGTQAALTVYDTGDNDTVKVIASEDPTKLNVLQEIKKHLFDQGEVHRDASGEIE